MRLLSRMFALVISVLIVLLNCGFAPTKQGHLEAPIVVTAAPAYEPLAALHGGERFPQGAQLLLMRDSDVQPLIAGFAATADADVSYDASHVLFAGKQHANDAWQVWELTLADKSVRRVTGSESDAVRPLYLPGDRLVYAQRTTHGFQMEAAMLDGSAVLPLTYFNGSAMPANVLHDGRILFESTYPMGDGTTPEMYLVYSDGSGVESYRCDHPAAHTIGRWGGRQLASGDVVFTHGSSLAKFMSPLAHETSVAAPSADYDGNIIEMADGTWLMSARSKAAHHYALMMLKPGAKLLQTVVTHDSEDVAQAVLLLSRAAPNRHPTALHDWTTANLLALDARQSRDGALASAPTSVRMEMRSTDGTVVTVGTAPVEADGSFFVKVPGDRQIRFALLDATGAVIRQERGWFWSRRGEQRICVGCHTGPEHAPENNMPVVLTRSTTPVDLGGAEHVSITGGH